MKQTLLSAWIFTAAGFFLMLGLALFSALFWVRRRAPMEREEEKKRALVLLGFLGFSVVLIAVGFLIVFFYEVMR